MAPLTQSVFSAAKKERWIDAVEAMVPYYGENENFPIKSYLRSLIIHAYLVFGVGVLRKEIFHADDIGVQIDAAKSATLSLIKSLTDHVLGMYSTAG